MPSRHVIQRYAPNTHTTKSEICNTKTKYFVFQMCEFLVEHWMLGLKHVYFSFNFKCTYQMPYNLTEHDCGIKMVLCTCDH